MPYSTQIRILELSASCQTVNTIAVFRDDKWRSPDQGYFGHCGIFLYVHFFSRHICGLYYLIVLWQWFNSLMLIRHTGSGLFSEF